MHHVFLHVSRYLGGKKVRGSDINGLEELVTICAMCNDSSVDYNEVCVFAHWSTIMIFFSLVGRKFFFLSTLTSEMFAVIKY